MSFILLVQCLTLFVSVWFGVALGAKTLWGYQIYSGELTVFSLAVSVFVTVTYLTKGFVCQ